MVKYVKIYKIYKNLDDCFLPPLPDQRKIAEILSTVDKKLEIERNEKERLKRIVSREGGLSSPQRLPACKECEDFQSNCEVRFAITNSQNVRFLLYRAIVTNQKDIRITSGHYPAGLTSMHRFGTEPCKGDEGSRSGSVGIIFVTLVNTVFGDGV